MRNILVLGFVLVCGVCFGQENDFYYVGENNAGAKYYDSLHKTDSIRGIKDIWVKCIYPSKTIKNKSGKFVKIKGETTISLYRIFCNETKMLALTYTKYDNKGNIVKNNQYSEYEEPQYIIPESMGEAHYNFACKNIVEWDPNNKIETE